MTQNNQDYRAGWGKINPQRLTAIRKHAGHVILDVGCATGDYVKFLNQQGYQARGCDIEAYPGWNATDFFLADANCLSQPSNSVDTITCFEVLEHVRKPLQALVAMHSACRKNLILSVPNCTPCPALANAGLSFNHYIDRSHCNFWTPREIGDLATEAGFAISRIELINQVHPESLFLAALRMPRSMAGLAGFCFNRLPWIQKYYMTVLVIANKQ